MTIKCLLVAANFSEENRIDHNTRKLSDEGLTHALLSPHGGNFSLINFFETTFKRKQGLSSV